MTRQDILDALIAERFTPCPERPAHNDDGPTAQVEMAGRVVAGPWVRKEAS